MAVGAPGAGLVVDMALVLALANGVLFAHSRALARLLAVLALVPLIRPVAMAMSFDVVPREEWPTLAGAPLLVGVLWAAHTVDFPLADRVLRSTLPGLRLALSAARARAGAYVPAGPRLAGPGPPCSPGPGLALLAAPAPGDPVPRRPPAARRRDLRSAPIVLVTLNGVYAVTLLGASLAFGLFMGAVGMAFSQFVRRHGTLGEVVVAHAGLSVFGVLVWPLVLG